MSCDFDYMDYFDEPSEVDKVIEEMKDKLHDLIKDEAKKMMDDYRQMDEEFENAIHMSSKSSIMALIEQYLY